MVGLASATELGVNLIFNGDAEYGRGYSDTEGNAGVPGWTDTGPMTVLVYGGSEGLPARDAPGAQERGDNFFCGGKGKGSAIMQVIDIADAADRIDRGVGYELSGWFGGYADQRDLAWLTVRFLGDNGGELGRTMIGEVTVQERIALFGEEDATGFLRRSASGGVPPGTRRIEVTLTAETGSGMCDGYADNLALVLTPAR